MKIFCGKWASVGACFLSATVLAFPAAASADDTDDAFIAGLSKGGITMPDNDDAIAKARAVCSGLDTNQNASALVIGLARQTSLSLKQSAYFVGLAVATYCPQYKDSVGPSVS